MGKGFDRGINRISLFFVELIYRSFSMGLQIFIYKGLEGLLFGNHSSLKVALVQIK